MYRDIINLSMILSKAIRKLLLFLFKPIFDLSKFERKQLYKLNGLVSKKTNKAALLKLIKRLAPIAPDGIPLIRMGSAYDGGYLIPDDLEGIEACFSPGVGNLIDFELDCHNRGINVFLADNTIDGNNLPLDKFHYTNKNIASFTNETLMTIDDWINNSGVAESSDLLLQMDIEGSEYAALANMSNTLQKRFRIIALEFHGLHNLWNQDYFVIASEVFTKLLETHHCVHIHPNNCDTYVEKDGIKIPITAEFTFIRKDRVGAFQKVTTMPHPLDTDNAQEVPHLELPPIWYL